MPQLLIQPLAATSFAPYGTVIEPGDASVPINSGTTQKFSDVAEVELDADARATMHIYRPETIDLPYRAHMLERHPLASQAFVPLGRFRFVVVVAGRANRPTQDDLRAFIGSGTQGVQFATGIWHHPFLAIDRGDFLIIDRLCVDEREADRNLDLIDIADWDCTLIIS